MLRRRVSRRKKAPICPSKTVDEIFHRREIKKEIQYLNASELKINGMKMRRKILKRAEGQLGYGSWSPIPHIFCGVVRFDPITPYSFDHRGIIACCTSGINNSYYKLTKYITTWSHAYDRSFPPGGLHARMARITRILRVYFRGIFQNKNATHLFLRDS